jgi:Mn-containing catalase
MFIHNKKLQYTVRVGEPNPQFAKMCMEQFGGPQGELAAAMRYFTQGWSESDPARRDMLLDIATEELSHLEMVGQIISGLLKGARSAGALIDELEGSYLGEFLDGNGGKFEDLAWNSMTPLATGGSGLRLTDSMGVPWTAAYIDSMGHPLADLRSDIAAEARAKVMYDRLIKLCDDPGASDALTFLMTREVAHQKMFESALASITANFPSSNVPPNEEFTHAYFAESTDGNGACEGFELVNAQGLWAFELSEPNAGGDEPDLPEPKPSVASATGPVPEGEQNPLSRVTAEQIAGEAPAATTTVLKKSKPKTKTRNGRH